VSEAKPEPITILCPECGELREVHDVQAVLLALHMTNECDVSTLITHGGTA
jgi:hypothetical protein